jgi:hypothetical protein
MKQRGYRVRVEKDSVSVEHRASIRPRTIVCLAIAYVCYCFLPAVRRVLTDFFASGDPVIGCFAMLLLLIPFLSGATWLFFASGEVMRCDAQELRFARRRSWGRWHRFCFSSAQVQELHRDYRGSGRNRHFTVLTFQCEKRTFDMLEDLSLTDSESVLHACKSMGLDVIIPVDEAAGMLHDIEQRGWFINPLRPDREENPVTKS